MSVAAFFPSHAQGLADEIRRAAARIVSGEDGEAVHDLRVAIRRLRAALRAVGPVFGRYHAAVVREGLKQVADATGDLRDAEVLGETLAALPLEPGDRAALDAWWRRRRARERALRRRVVLLVASGALVRPLAQLDGLLILPVRPKKDRPVGPFANDAIASEGKRVAKLAQGAAANVADAEAMHALRIAHKRQRYTAELFVGVAPESAEVIKHAAKVQKRLGELHDLDVALSTVVRARALLPPVRAEVLRALSSARAACEASCALALSPSEPTRSGKSRSSPAPRP